MILEIIATSVADAVLAQNNGADRIELISGIREGGVTPSIGLIEKVLDKVHIPVHVMVRPHANSFYYDEEDLEVMVRDIISIRNLGAAGIVTGALDRNRTLDISILNSMFNEAGELSVTFHRAFDEMDEQQSALQELASYPSIQRVLTSGGKPSALEAIEQIRALVKQCEHLPLQIIAGSGLNVETLDNFISATEVREVHMGTGVRLNGQALAPVDPVKVRAAAEIIAKYK